MTQETALENNSPAERLAEVLGPRKVQAVNQLLQEGLFFYRKDDPALYATLRERSSLFKEFWDRYFGYDLVIEEHVAYRTINVDADDPSAGFRNPNLPLAARGVFWFTGRNKRERVLIFLRFLQYYEEELRATEDAGNAEHYFFYHEFFNRVQKSFDEWFAHQPGRKPDDRALFQATRDVINTLTRHRFVEIHERKDLGADDAAQLPKGYTDDHVILMRALPGLRGYNPRTLKESLVHDAYQTERIPATLDEDPHGPDGSDDPGGNS